MTKLGVVSFTLGRISLASALIVLISCSGQLQKPILKASAESENAMPAVGDPTAPTGPETTVPSDMPADPKPSDEIVIPPVVTKPDEKPDSLPMPKPDEPKPALVWAKADLTHYESYPDPGSEECLEYNGCTWAGLFAALDGKQPESWVKANNIIAVHEKDFKKYKLKTLRLRKGSKEIDVKVYDMCADSDCNGCCTKNAKSGFLIDIEKYTMKRFSDIGDGRIEWACVDCK